MRLRDLILPLLCAAALSTALDRRADGQTSADSLHIRIDARDLPRRLLAAELTVPLEAAKTSRKIALWYPKWVPGSHGPGGPIANVAGLQIQTADGRRLAWTRTPGEVYRILVDVPAGTDRLQLSVRYIANQPTTNSYGHDCFGGRRVGVISPGCVLLYPEDADIDATRIACRLRLPHGWQAATALPAAAKPAAGDAPDAKADIAYAPASLRTFVDSPIMCGRHYTAFDLVEESERERIPPHRLHVFTDEPTETPLHPEILTRLQGMVTQAARLIGAHPFQRFDILLAASSELSANGLEHARSTFNVLPPAALRSPANLKGWNRLLIPHEYLHAWCGKYRRPAGMLTPDFHTPKDTELLWVYEGLTQYLGELIEARCGLMTPDEFRHRLNVELRRAMHVQGRQWRTLADTAAASHILRQGSSSWSGLRRSQDYYMEGMLFWLEADARIRHASDGTKSLDDFCHTFLGRQANGEQPAAFTRQEVLEQLGALADVDWEGLIQRRIESLQEDFDPAAAGLLGYALRQTSEPPGIPGTTFRHVRGVDALDSLGVLVSRDGKVRDLMLGSPADRARLRPGMQITGVNHRTWSGPRLLEALEASRDGSPVTLLVVEDETYREVQLHDYEGPRYWNLVRREDASDLLSDILQPR